MSEENALGIDYGDVVAGYRLETGDFAQSIGAIVRGYAAIIAEVLELQAVLSTADRAFAGVGAAALTACAPGHGGIPATRQRDAAGRGDGGTGAGATGRGEAHVRRGSGWPREVTRGMPRRTLPARYVSRRRCRHGQAPPQPRETAALLEALRVLPRQRPAMLPPETPRAEPRQHETTLFLPPRYLAERMPEERQEGRQATVAQEQRHAAVEVRQHGAREAAEEHTARKLARGEIAAALAEWFAGRIPARREEQNAFPRMADALRPFVVSAGERERAGEGYQPVSLPAGEPRDGARDTAMLTLVAHILACCRESLPILPMHGAGMHDLLRELPRQGMVASLPASPALPLFAGRGWRPAAVAPVQAPLRLEVTVKAGEEFSAQVAEIADQRIQVVVIPALQQANRV